MSTYIYTKVNRDNLKPTDIPTWLPMSLYKGESIVKIISIDGKQQDNLFGFLRMYGRGLAFIENNIMTQLSTIDSSNWPISPEDDDKMSYDELQIKYAPKILE